MTIANITNGESGGSVRTSLNSVIDEVNTRITVSGTLSASDIHGAYAAPVEIIPALGALKVPVLLNGYAEMIAGSQSYTNQIMAFSYGPNDFDTTEVFFDASSGVTTLGTNFLTFSAGPYALSGNTPLFDNIPIVFQTQADEGNTGAVNATSLGSSGGTGYVPGDTGNINGGGNDALYSVDTVDGDRAILTSALGAGGALYAVNDTGTITTGGANAAYIVDTVDGGGAVLTYHLTNAGTGYVVGAGQATATGGGQPGVGTGMTIDVNSTNGVGAVLTFHLTANGTGYNVGTNVATTVGSGSGDGGFTVNIDSITPGNGSIKYSFTYAVLDLA